MSIQYNYIETVLDDLGIQSVIHIRNTDKNGIYTVKGQPKCLGGRAMDYIRTDAERGHLFRCPADGCRLKGKIGFTLYCGGEHFETVEGDLLRRVGRIPRAGRRWKRLYKWRTTIERMFGSMKASRLLNLHRYRGIRKVRLHAALCMLTYLATMLRRAKAGDLADIRQMRIPLPVSRAQGLPATA